MITHSHSSIRANVSAFLQESGLDTALIRHDKRIEAPSHPRGGFLVGKTTINETIDFFLSLNRIVAVYKPADPLLNGYNMNFLFESEIEVYVEVVGPGFDASDLQRGDLSPHETYSVALSAKGDISDFKLLRRVDLTGYEESVRLRKEKIHRKLESSPSRELASRIREDLGIPHDLDAHLQSINSPLCNSESYRPIPEELLQHTLRLILQSGTIKLYLESTGVGFPLVFSTSCVNGGTRQVFWDIVSPALKFEGLAKR